MIFSGKKRGEEPVKPDSKQLSLVALSEDEVIEIIRPEENLERWSNFIFPHARTKGLDQVRKKSWDISLADGREAVGAITIDPPTSGRAYSYRSYDVYLALVAIWNDQGHPDAPFKTSLREIARRMNVPENGHWMKLIDEELSTLYKTVLTWTLSFKADSEHQSVKNQHVLETYDYLKLNERPELKDRFEQVCMVRFDQKIRDNLRQLRTIPVNWTARKSITSPIAKVLYNRLDNILAKHPIYERTACNLVDDLALTPGRYKYKSQRKQLVSGILKQLNGKRLSNLRILNIQVEETVNGKDWKLVFKTKSDRKPKQASNNLPIVNKDPDKREMLIDQIAQVVGEIDKNYKLYNLFSLYYSDNLIHRSLGEFKELTKDNKAIKNKAKYFTATLHAIAHKMGKEWIKDCGKNCKHRPENNLPL